MTEDWVKADGRHARTQEKVDRFALIGREELLALSNITSPRVVAIVLIDCLIVAATILASEYFRSAWVYVVAVMIIGARQFGLASIGLHDGAHGLLFRNRKVNDFVALLLTEPFFVGLLDLHLKSYRRQHFEHHRHANDSQDPDAGFFAAWFQASPGKRLLLLLANGTGFTFVLLVVRVLRRGSWAARGTVFVLVLGIAGGLAWSVYPVVLLFKYWVVPFATWGMFTNTLRAVAEHYPAELAPNPDPAIDEVFRTRDVILSWFDSLFVVTRGVNFHLTHHLFPSVPFFRLKRLQRTIAGREPYRGRAHVTFGYHRVLREVLVAQASHPGETARRWIFF